MYRSEHIGDDRGCEDHIRGPKARIPQKLGQELPEDLRIHRREDAQLPAPGEQLEHVLIAPEPEVEARGREVSEPLQPVLADVQAAAERRARPKALDAVQRQALVRLTEARSIQLRQLGRK